jgi:hypothetical protein
MKSQRAAATFLRFVAVLQMLTAGVAIVPLAWIGAWHLWVGLGAMSHDPMLPYVLRTAGFVQGGIGVLLWIMASDVPRYRPLILATAGIYLIAGPTFYFIESIAQIPLFWCMLDSVSCLATGAILLALSLRSRAGGPATA